jgi:hypothetical protein
LLGITCLVIADDLQVTNLDDPALGVEVRTASEIKDILKEKAVEPPTKLGVFVNHIEPYSPAARAKVQLTDIITHVNKKPVQNTDEFIAAVSELSIGKEYELGGYSLVQTGNKFRWKKGTVKITPVSKRDVFLNALRKTTDTVREVASYQHIDSQVYVNTRSDFYAYIVTSADVKPTLKLRIQYVANDWLFIRGYTIKADESAFTIKADGIRDVERDNSGGKIWEWHDLPVGDRELEMIKVIIRADRVILRCEGDKYVKDRLLSDAEVRRLGTVLTAFQIMKKEQ